MVSARRNRDDPTLGKDPARLARSVDRMAPCIRSDGRGSDELEPCRRSAQPCLDGNAGADPRSDRAGPLPDVAFGELKAAADFTDLVDGRGALPEGLPARCIFVSAVISGGRELSSAAVALARSQGFFLRAIVEAYSPLR